MKTLNPANLRYKISATAFTRSKPGDKLVDGGGLYLEVGKNGRKTWRYRYRLAGKENVFTIGEATLAEAREKHRQARRHVAEGRHPLEVKRAEHSALEAERKQQTREQENTFGAVARQWQAIQSSKWSKSTAYTWGLQLAALVEEIGHKPIATIRRADCSDLILRIAERAPSVADVSRDLLRRVFRFAIAKDLIDADPTAALFINDFLPRVETVHFPAVDAATLPAFLRALDGATFHPVALAAFRLALLTAKRPSEVRLAQWREFDLVAGTWSLPAARMKARRAHVDYLSRQSIELLKALRETTGDSEYVFEGKFRNKPIDSTVLSRLPGKLGFKGQHTTHGNRALMRSTMAELGYDTTVLERILAHGPKGQVDKAYDRAKYVEQRREIAQAWADYLDRTREGAEVIPLNRVA